MRHRGTATRGSHPRAAPARPGPRPPDAILPKMPRSRWAASILIRIAAGAGLSSSIRVVFRLAAINSKSGSR